MSNLAISIDGGLLPGEKVIQRLDVSVPVDETRQAQALMAFASLVIYCLVFVGLIFLIRDLLHFMNLAILFFISVVSFKIFDRFLKYTFPEYSELVVTNQRLFLRAGPRFWVWVSNYDSEIEVFVREESSAFVIRPTREYCSPKEVFVKSLSPLAQGKEFADLLRSFRGNSAIAESSTVDIISSSEELALKGRTTSGAKAPPGIAVTHAFLDNQLRSIINSIPLPSFARVDFGHIDSSRNTQPSMSTDSSSDLGDTGYHFGVEQ